MMVKTESFGLFFHLGPLVCEIRRSYFQLCKHNCVGYAVISQSCLVERAVCGFGFWYPINSILIFTTQWGADVRSSSQANYIYMVLRRPLWDTNTRKRLQTSNNLRSWTRVKKTLRYKQEKTFRSHSVTNVRTVRDDNVLTLSKAFRAWNTVIIQLKFTLTAIYSEKTTGKHLQRALTIWISLMYRSSNAMWRLPMRDSEAHVNCCLIYCTLGYCNYIWTAGSVTNLSI